MTTMEPLSAAEIESFHQNGYLVARSFLADEDLKKLSAGVLDVEGWPPAQDKWIHHFEETATGVKLSRSENFVPFHPILRSLICEDQLIHAVSQLCGEPAVLYKEKINYKHPGGGGFAAHQDAPAYDFVSINVTANVAIDPSTRENGCLWFSPGEFKELLPMNDAGCLARQTVETLSWRAVELHPGDVVFFDSFSPHFSRQNLSDQPRRSLYLTYNKLSEGDCREAYYAARQQALHDSYDSGRISKIGHFMGKTVK